MTQEFELLELNLIHTQAKYNSPGWKWSRTPELTFSTFAKEPEAVWWQTVRTSLLFLNWKKVRPASYDRHFPPWQGTGSSPLEGSVLPLDSSLPLASLLFFGGFLFKGLFVGQLGQHNFRWQGWISFIPCASLEYKIIDCTASLLHLPKPLLWAGPGDHSVYEKLKPHH